MASYRELGLGTISWCNDSEVIRLLLRNQNGAHVCQYVDENGLRNCTKVTSGDDRKIPHIFTSILPLHLAPKWDPKIARLVVFSMCLSNFSPHHFCDGFLMVCVCFFDRFSIFFMLHLDVFGYLFENS